MIFNTNISQILLCMHGADCDGKDGTNKEITHREGQTCLEEEIDALDERWQQNRENVKITVVNGGDLFELLLTLARLFTLLLRLQTACCSS